MITVNSTVTKLLSIHAALADEYPAVIGALLLYAETPSAAADLIRTISSKIGVAAEMAEKDEFPQSKAMRTFAISVAAIVGMEPDEISIACELSPSQNDRWDHVGAVLAGGG